MKADLHMHTTESDGRFSREDLFKYVAEKKDVDIISITDHDTCLHVEDNQRLSALYGIHYIPGIELSTLYKGKSVHVLGYFKGRGYEAKAMKQYYKMIKTGREERAKKFIENLKTYFDIDIAYERLLELSHGVIARPHIARAIQENYPQYSHNQIFDAFIGDHAKAFVPSTELSTEEGIALLKKHDAVVVLAHPKLLKPSIHDEVLKLPFDGIEAIYGLNASTETAYYKQIAKDKDWLFTAGSDFHGIKHDTSHKDVGEVFLSGDALALFLKRVNKKIHR